MLQLGRNKSRTNVYTIVTLHFWSAVCCFTCLSCGCCTIIYRYITYLSCICFTRLLLHVSGLYLFQSYLSFHTVIIYNSGFFLFICFFMLPGPRSWSCPRLKFKCKSKIFHDHGDRTTNTIVFTRFLYTIFIHDCITRLLLRAFHWLWVS